MLLNIFRWQSLKTRVTLATLFIFIAGIWSLSYFVSWMLRQDMERLLGEQQLSTVSMLAIQVNHQLKDRLSTLEHVAGLSAAAMQKGPAAMQSLIEQRWDLHALFNGGIYVAGLDGTALADYPLSAGRISVNYLDRDYIAIPLREGKSVIGRPVIGKKAQAPVFVMAAPIRNAEDKVIGVITGLTFLDEPNFLDQITESRYGKTGGYLLVTTRERQIVTATDKSRIMETLPAPGISPLIDRFMGGYEGYGVFVNPLGVEVLASANNITVAGWYVAAVLPTAEAFAPIRTMQQRMLLATIVLTLLAIVLIGWILRRQLAPLLLTAQRLAAMSDNSLPAQALPIARYDEIGQLIAGFNSLLETLEKRETALRDSHEVLHSMLSTTADGYWRVDTRGHLLDANPAYSRLSGYSRAELLEMTIADLEALKNASEITERIHFIVSNGSAQFETRHRRKDGSVWHVEVSATYRDITGGELLVFLRDISARKHSENATRLSETRLRRAELASKAGNWELHLDTRTIIASEGAIRLYGLDREKYAFSTIQKIPLPEYRPLLDAAFRNLVDNNEPYAVEFKIKTADTGELKDIHSTAYLDRENGIVFGIIRDITERKQAEEALRRSETSFRNFFDKNTSVLLLTDPISGEIIDANVAASNYYGYPRSQLMRMNISDLNTMLPEHIAEQRQRALRGECNTFYFVHRLASGALRDVEVHLTPIESGGRPVLFSIIHDITERRQAEGKLQLAAGVFAHAREGILITRMDGAIIDVNDSFTRITGYSRAEVLGQNPRLLSSGHQGKEFYAAMWGALNEKGHWYGELWNRRKNGEVFATMQTISTVFDALGAAQHFISLFTDITSLKEHEKQLEHMAHYDVLTTLPNRVLLADRLHQAMAQAQRRGQLLAVAYLDLDGFKAINDQHGHETGDQLLIALAGRMKQALREGDTLARLGGDEFIAVLLDLEDIAASVPMLNRLLAAAALPVPIEGLSLQVSASLGVTFYPQAEEADADQLLRQSDQAMYQAKLAGKNRYHLFDAEQDRSVRGHHESLEHIRRALTAREFVLHYQPKVNMRTGAVIGAEALIRWQHPERGLLPPAVFLPVIENHLLAIELGEWVIDSALTQMELWYADGLAIPVSVNIGARQLLHADFAPRLREILANHPAIRPGDLSMEVLETSALEDLARVSQIIEDCRGLGVSFALDDFGTGYSSLTYLKRLAVSQLKIDQSFVRDMLDDPDDLSILGGVLSLANAFRREVIAEGVETVEHGTLLLLLGCELAQGYGIARPMPAADLPAWAAAWHPASAWSNLPPANRDDLPLLFASVEHRAWVIAVEDFLEGKRETLPLVHHQCRLGAWLEAEGQVLHEGQADFLAIEPLHRQAHLLATQLCEIKAHGRHTEALARLAELHCLRDALLEQLQKLVMGSRP